MPEFPYRLTGKLAVAAVIATVRSDPAFVAGCLVVGTAHGFTMELEYMQRSDGTMRYRVWSDVQGIVSTEDRTLAIDFAAELPALRAEVAVETRLPDVDGQGRRALVVLATAETGTWVDAPTPGDHQPAGAGALGRIIDVVFPA